ncbi:hypothetical protein ElyMa_002697700 [Elysia marginata]|uniref:Late endosomal/lysosomal adaptor and MAPK and MTOR activator 5 n=1 Tax=Elysia marginata TaxID=1093978 RepID=A0AAV4HDT2_9GAST|nr:hypothetical protein ElyMa_002697700 [Elysia marginata]
MLDYSRPVASTLRPHQSSALQPLEQRPGEISNRLRTEQADCITATVTSDTVCYIKTSSEQECHQVVSDQTPLETLRADDDNV